jgi:DNA-binding response OmpR family regulator
MRRMATESETILLVDDRPANLVALEALLLPLGHRLVKAASGQEALRFLLYEECALILLDVQMPDLDGFETAAMIRARKRTSETPIIFVTAIHSEEEQVIRGYSLGAVDYIVKPFDGAALVAKVQGFLEQDGLKRRARARFVHSLASRPGLSQQ